MGISPLGEPLTGGLVLREEGPTARWEGREVEAEEHQVGGRPATSHGQAAAPQAGIRRGSRGDVLHGMKAIAQGN